MRALVLGTLLLSFVECGYHYGVLLDGSEEVSGEGVALQSRQNLIYRVAARGVNHCCDVRVDIINLGSGPLSLTPGAATLTSGTCKPDLHLPVYVEGAGVGSLAELDAQAWERLSSSWQWLEMRGPDQQFSIAPRAFIQLSYYAAPFRKECAPYSFSLKAGGDIVISATFIPPG